MNRPTRGDFCYVDVPDRGVCEAEVVSPGRTYKVRLKKNDLVIVAPNSSVWSAFPSPKIAKT